jgi:hypothetical protein
MALTEKMSIAPNSRYLNEDARNDTVGYEVESGFSRIMGTRVQKTTRKFTLKLNRQKHWCLAVTLLGGLYIASCLPIEQGTIRSPSPTRLTILTPQRLPTDTSSIPESTKSLIKDLPTATPIPSTPTQPEVLGRSRGYLTTPQELDLIKMKADQGIEPYQSAVAEVLAWANEKWDFRLRSDEKCKNSEKPAWNDNEGGTPILYAKALAYQLMDNEQYAQAVRNILERIMTEVETISVEDPQCRLNLGWGTPELVASADLIEDYWKNQTCSGPISTSYQDTTKGTGNCKVLFQNWLVKNPYYVVSYSAVSGNSNWGAAATNATAYIADYLWDRPDVRLIHRYPNGVNNGEDIARSPSKAFAYANQLALDRMNGYTIEYGSNDSCDYLSGPQQSDKWPPVKSQITENGIIPEDARRDEYCNIPIYNGEYQNYPQLHLGHNVQQCELMLRRGDRSCYDNVDDSDIPNYKFVGPDGEEKITHLFPGRGSIERAIKAIIVDSATEWRKDPALEVAYRYYFNFQTLPGFEYWFSEISRPTGCGQDICFGTLTHGFAPDENPGLPPFVSPP